MKRKHFSTTQVCLTIGGVMLFGIIIITGIFYGITQNADILLSGTLSSIYAGICFFSLVMALSKRLSSFTSDLCQILDNMRNGEKIQKIYDEETLFCRIEHHLSRLYDIMQENRNKVEKERQELQMLISDISHQVKMPISNLIILTDTLLAKPVTQKERTEFLQNIRSQADKLNFLVQVLVKTSRLETGMINLEKKENNIYHTLVQAVSGIVYEAEKKEIEVTISCPETLQLLYDSKWTEEAIFNLLDNAVKYTSNGGKIHIAVEQWEMYTKIDVTDTGKGIAENHQAAIFQRFYREEEVHEVQGIGIGLFLTREIIIRQGGYIKVSSEIGKGSTFSIFLPRR